MNVDEMRDKYEQQTRRAAEAQRALEVAGPYLRNSRASLMEAWAREPDPAKREEAWHAVRAHDHLLKRMQDEIATGEQAKAELRFLAEQETPRQD